MRKALITFIILLFITGCSTNPVTGKKELTVISESYEISVGESNYKLMQQAQGGVYNAEKEVGNYVSKVGNKLAAVSDRPHLPFEFVVLDNSVPNAWSLPGGKIAINRGLLIELNNEAELAAVLGHEIVHSAARHGANMMERAVLMSAGLVGLQQILKGHKYEDVAMAGAALGSTLGMLKYSREAEFEADKYGIKYMVAAGYDPQGAVELQELFLKLSKGKRSNWFSTLFLTHPPSEDRIQANKQTAASYPPVGFMGVEEYQKAIAPLKKAQEAYDALDKGYECLGNHNFEGALYLAERGIKIEPNEAHLYNLKGKAQLALRNFDDALQSFDKAIQLNNDYFDFYLQKGLVEQRLGYKELAKQDLTLSASLLPSAEAEYALGQIYTQEGNRKEALKHFQIAAQADTKSGAAARENLGRTDLAQHPERYIKILTSNNNKGELYLNIDNQSSADVKNIEVLITFVDSHHKILHKQHHKIYRTIPSNKRITLSTSIKNPPKTAKIYTQILGAEIAF